MQARGAVFSPHHQHHQHHGRGYNHRDRRAVVSRSAQVGKWKLFDKIKHGMDVNLKNFKHGMDVNASNAKAAVLKVGAAPARNSFLALLDINMFDMAVRLHYVLATPKAGELLQKWKDLGGDPNKLKSAINNGVKHHNYYGKGKVTGLHYNGAAIFENSQFIGVEPVTTASLMALASGIIAALSKFLKKQPGEPGSAPDMAPGSGTLAKAGADMLLNKAKAAADLATDSNLDQAAALQTLAAPGGGGVTMTPGINAAGEPTVTVHDIDHPAVQDAGGARDQSGAMVQSPGVMADLKGFILEHKKELAIVGGSLAVLIIGSRFICKKKKR